MRTYTEEGWYIDEHNPSWAGYFKYTRFIYGIDMHGNWFDTDTYSETETIEDRNRKATEEEMRVILQKMALRIGFKADTKIGEYISSVQPSKNDKSFRPIYYISQDRLFNKNGLIYSKGKWATPVFEEIEPIEKAHSLVNKFQNIIIDNYSSQFENAKQCAITCVDTILDDILEIDRLYWIDVRNEVHLITKTKLDESEYR